MRRYGEIRVVENGKYGVMEVLWDALGLLIGIGFMILLLFLAGGR